MKSFMKGKELRRFSPRRSRVVSFKALEVLDQKSKKFRKSIRFGLHLYHPFFVHFDRYETKCYTWTSEDGHSVFNLQGSTKAVVILQEA